MNTAWRWAVAGGLAILACAEVGLAQEPVGVVTTLAGQASRTASPGEAPAPLRFKDGVFGADTIRTAERSFVRMLLKRKAVLTVRELSVVRITEDATQATVDLKAGGIAFSVARARLRPGETVLVRTPNAVAAVRGTTIVVETQGSVTHFRVLTGALDVAASGNPTAWQRLQTPGSLTVTGSVVGKPRGLDNATRDRITTDYLSLRVAELSAPSEVVAQEQAKAVLLARLISGDGSGGDQVEMLAVTDSPVSHASPGMQTPTQAPLTPPVVPGAPPVTAVPGTPPTPPPPPPIQSWSSQTATVTGDLLNVPAAASSTLASSLASATGSTVTVTNEVVDVTGRLTAGAASPFVALQSSTLASRTLALVQTGSLTLTGGPLLEAVGGGASTTDDLLRITGGGRLVGPAGGPLLSLSGATLGVGNGTGDRLLELTGTGSRLSLGGALLDATGSTVSLTGTSLVEVTTGAALDVAGASLVNLTGGALMLNGAATGFLFSSATPSTLGGSLLATSGTDINAGMAAPGNLLSVSGPLTSGATTPLLSLSGGDVRARNLGVVSSAAGVLTLGGAFLDRSGAGSTLLTTDDLLNVSAGARLVAGGTDALLRFTDTTVSAGNGTGDQLPAHRRRIERDAGRRPAAGHQYRFHAHRLVPGGRLHRRGSHRDRRRPPHRAVGRLARPRQRDRLRRRLDRGQPDRGQPAAHHQYRHHHDGRSGQRLGHAHRHRHCRAARSRRRRGGGPQRGPGLHREWPAHLEWPRARSHGRHPGHHRRCLQYLRGRATHEHRQRRAARVLGRRGQCGQR